MTMRLFTLLLVVGCITVDASAQLERVRARPGGPVDEVFWAPAIVVVPSVTNVGAGDLHFTIQHSFGRVSDGASELWGLDGTANIRFGLDYGLTDRLSVGAGRSRFDKVYDFRSKWNVLRQTKDNRVPIEVALAGNAGITTLENGFSFDDRLTYAGSLLLARRVSDELSVQIAPTVSHFNVVFRELDRFGDVVEEENTHLALALAARYVVHPQVSLAVEYVPVLGSRSDGTTDMLSFAVNIETGGHVFQLFFTSSRWITLQHAVARNDDAFFDGDIRFGFNVNRVF